MAAHTGCYFVDENPKDRQVMDRWIDIYIDEMVVTIIGVWDVDGSDDDDGIV